MIFLYAFGILLFHIIQMTRIQGCDTFFVMCDTFIRNRPSNPEPPPLSRYPLIYLPLYILTDMGSGNDVGNSN